MKSRRRTASTGTEGSGSSQIMGLSLFIMLLAFFIVLNAISTFEEDRVRPTMNSIERAFATKIAAEEDKKPSVVDGQNLSIQQGSTVDRLEALFAAHIPSHDAVVQNERGEMYVRVPLDEFEAAFVQTDQKSTDMRGRFITTMAALMMSADQGRQYRMDMLAEVNDDPARLQNEKPQETKALMMRMAAIAGAMEEIGLPRRYISIGLRQGKAGYVEIHFRLHEPYSPVDENGIVQERSDESGT
ncbi:MAG: hypothetical protein H6868_05340 [Rhodospirillales bacterium]|nr:hypothetical protein [Rhodospirillales bacterium]